ncbi:twin-arginine translocase TatA/TatE family subunit [Nitrospira sp. M1]
MFGSIGFTELILILTIVLIIFGAGKLPQLGEGVGKAIKGFKKSIHEVEAMDAEAQEASQHAATEAPAPAQIPQQEPVATAAPSAPPAPSTVAAMDNAPNTETVSASKA